MNRAAPVPTAVLGIPLADIDPMLNVLPVPVLIEDFSGARQLLAQWAREGVTDLFAHGCADPQRLQQLAQSVVLLRANRACLDLLGARDLAELVSRIGEIFAPEMRPDFLREMVALWDGATGYAQPTHNYRLDGRRVDVLVKGQLLPGHEADWSRVLVVLDDITALNRASQAHQREAAYAHGLFEHSPVSLWVEDFSEVKSLLDEVRQQGIVDFRTFLGVHPEFVDRCMQAIRVLDVNQQTLTLFGANDKTALLRQTDRIFRDEMRRTFAEQLLDLWKGQLVQQREVINYSLQGDQLHVHLQLAVLDGHQADWDLVVVSLVDITARKKAEAYLEYLGKHDALTKLRNRAFYTDEVNRLQRRGHGAVGIIAIDLNGLKAINDTDGHGAGDSMLRRAGEVLAKAVDPPCTASRTGGDEFVVLLPGADPGSLNATVARIRSLMELNNSYFSGQPMSMSLGAVLCHPGESLEAAAQRADDAMYDDKRRHYQALGLERRTGRKDLA
jgi:diguanylate cyclase (GGDEF)-like protein